MPFMYVHMKMSPKFKLYYAVMLLMFCSAAATAGQVGCMCMHDVVENNKAVTSNNEKIAKKFYMKGIVGWMDGWLAAAVVKNFFVKTKNKDIYFISSVS